MVSIYVRVYIQTHVEVRMFANIYIWVCVCVCMCVYVCTEIDILTYEDKYLGIRICSPIPASIYKKHPL